MSALFQSILFMAGLIGGGVVLFILFIAVLAVFDKRKW